MSPSIRHECVTCYFCISVRKRARHRIQDVLQCMVQIRYATRMSNIPRETEVIEVGPRKRRRLKIGIAHRRCFTARCRSRGLFQSTFPLSGSNRSVIPQFTGTSSKLKLGSLCSGSAILTARFVERHVSDLPEDSLELMRLRSGPSFSITNHFSFHLQR